MEDCEPYDSSDDSCRDQEDKRVPRQVPDALLEPVWPHSEQKEEEHEANDTDEPQLSLALALLYLEDVETSWGDSHVLAR